MPVTGANNHQETIYQRDQYSKGGFGRWYWDKKDLLVLDHVRSTDWKIVDLGCGEGITLEKLHRLFPNRDVLGIDVLAENVDICRSHDCKVEKGDVYNLQLPSRSIDFVLFMEVIEHLDQPEVAIQEIKRILAPDGRLVIVIPNDRFFKLARLLALRLNEAAYDPGHVRQLAPREMMDFLKKQGFAPVFSRNLPFYIWPVSLHCIIAADKKS